MVHPVALLSSSTSLGGVPAITDALDNAIRDDLQSRSGAFFLCVLISAGVVVVGVALEGPEIFHELWPKLFSWFTWQSNKRLHEFERRIKIIGLAGWLLVVFGVAGEAVFEVLQNRAEGQLQTFNGILLKDARLTASTARQSALDAADASARANAEAGAAHDLAQSVAGIAGSAKNEAEQARAEAHSATNEARSAEIDLAKVRTDVARVEVKYAPRTLSKTERDSLIKSLKNAPLHPDTAIEVDSFIGATDGVSYATEIVDAINDPRTGWHAQYGAQNARGGNLKGLVLLIHSTDSAPSWGLYLQRALKDAGLGGDGVISNDQAPGTLMIFVAPKN